MLLTDPPGATGKAARALTSLTSPTLRQLIVSHAPRVFELEDQANALKAAAAKIPEIDPHTGKRTVLDALAAGSIDDIDLVQTLGSHTTAANNLFAAYESMRDVLNELRHTQEAEARAGADAIMAELDHRAVNAVTTLREHPLAHRGITTADAAIAADAVEDWKTWTAARAAYHGVYDALNAILNSGVLDADTTAYRQDSWANTRLANPDQLWPNFADYRAGHTAARPPWPVADTLGRASAKPDPDAWLDWLIATPKAQPAVLTPQAHDARIEHQRQLARAAAQKAGKTTEPAVWH